jgi:hypothetical protein
VIARYSSTVRARRSGIKVGLDVLTVFTFREGKVRALAHYSESP